MKWPELRRVGSLAELKPESAADAAPVSSPVVVAEGVVSSSGGGK
jgi:hypothetical protein